MVARIGVAGLGQFRQSENHGVAGPEQVVVALERNAFRLGLLSMGDFIGAGQHEPCHAGICSAAIRTKPIGGSAPTTGPRPKWGFRYALGSIFIDRRRTAGGRDGRLPCRSGREGDEAVFQPESQRQARRLTEDQSGKSSRVLFHGIGGNKLTGAVADFAAALSPLLLVATPVARTATRHPAVSPRFSGCRVPARKIHL